MTLAVHFVTLLIFYQVWWAHQRVGTFLSWPSWMQQFPVGSYHYCRDHVEHIILWELYPLKKNIFNWCVPSSSLIEEESQHWRNLSYACHIQVNPRKQLSLKIQSFSNSLFTFFTFFSVFAFAGRAGGELILLPLAVWQNTLFVNYQVIFYRFNGGNENASDHDWWIFVIDWTCVNCRSEFLLVCDRDHLASFAQVPCSFGHLVIWSLGQLVSWSLGHLIPWSVGHLVPWSVGHLVPSSFGHLVIWSFDPSVSWSFGPLVIWSFGPLVSWDDFDLNFQ